MVWVGKLHEHKTTKIEPYIALIDGNKVRCGQFYIRTNLAVKKPTDCYRTYSVSVANEKINETREVSRNFFFFRLGMIY